MEDKNGGTYLVEGSGGLSGSIQEALRIPMAMALVIWWCDRETGLSEGAWSRCDLDVSPAAKSPNDDNGYDISDYRAIMDEFGDHGRLPGNAGRHP